MNCRREFVQRYSKHLILTRNILLYFFTERSPNSISFSRTIRSKDELIRRRSRCTQTLWATSSAPTYCALHLNIYLQPWVLAKIQIKSPQSTPVRYIPSYVNSTIGQDVFLHLPCRHCKQCNCYCEFTKGLTELVHSL